MDARHCAGAEMAELMAYAAVGRLGPCAARSQAPSGFVGCAADGDRAISLAPRHGARHDAARPHRLRRVDGARRGDVPRNLSWRGPDRARRLFRAGDPRTGSKSPAAFPLLPPRAGSPFASTRLAAAIARGSTRPAPTKCWNGTRRTRSAATALKRNYDIWSAPGSRRRRSCLLRRTLDEAGFTAVKIVAIPVSGRRNAG